MTDLRWTVPVAAAALSGWTSGAAGQVWTREVVAFNGGQAAGLPAGVNYSALQNNTAPYLDPSGAIAFTSLLTGAVTSTDNRALFFGLPGSITSILRESGVPGQLGEPGSFMGFNGGTLVFSGSYVGAPATSNGALFTVNGGIVTERVREGNVPSVIETGQPTDLTWIEVTTLPTVAGNGQIAFNALLGGTGLDGSNNSAIYAGPPALPRRVVQNGDALPDAGPGTSGVTMSFLNTPPLINEQGKVIFSGELAGTGIASPNLTAYILATPTSLAAPNPAYTYTFITRRGLQAPGLDAGITFAQDFNTVLTRTMDRFANLAFVQTVAGPGVSTTNNEAVFLGSANAPASITRVFRKGDLIPGAQLDERWSSFQTVALDGSGSAATDSSLWVRALLAGTAVTLANNSIIARVTQAGTTTFVLREGDAAPAPLPAGTLFGDFTRFVVNRNGTIVFTAALTGPSVSSSNDSALFIKRLNQDPVLLLREGDTFALSVGTRTASSFLLRGNNAGQSGGESSLNDDDKLAIGVNFVEDPATTDAIVYFAPDAPPACPADFDGVNGVDVQDIFSFLNAWFAGDVAADFDGMNGVEVQDIFTFLNAWFAGC